jgi:hypothetical protein
MAKRCCAACQKLLDRDYFSSNQWGKPLGVSRCVACIDIKRHVATQPSQTARRNESSNATFPHAALRNPFAQGAFRWVAKGSYTDGPRNGQACVCKWFKTGHVMESVFFDLDIKAMHKALDIVEQWNSHGYINQTIKVNMPAVWEFTAGSIDAGKKVLQEPFIEKYQKFNSNTGWADSSTSWPQVMQALSHFSYHVSAGQFVLCDLQGGVYSNAVVLTDPVILSRTKAYGVTDLGAQGISSFFSNHKCNQFCRSNWNLPADRSRYHAIQAGTSMAGSTVRPVPHQRSRNALSAVNEFYF